MPAKRKVKQTGGSLSSMYNSAKKMVMNVDAKLKKFKPLSTIDSYIGSKTRANALGAIPVIGGYLNQGYDLGKSQLGYRKKRVTKKK